MSHKNQTLLLFAENVLNTGKCGGHASDLTDLGNLSDSFVGVCSSAAFFYAIPRNSIVYYTVQFYLNGPGSIKGQGTCILARQYTLILSIDRLQLPSPDIPSTYTSMHGCVSNKENERQGGQIHIKKIRIFWFEGSTLYRSVLVLVQAALRPVDFLGL